MTTLTNLSVITSIRFNSNLIEALKHLTFIYDAGYATSNLAREYGTRSFCMFDVVRCQEIMQTDVSSKPMLFYDYQSDSTKEVTSGGAMSIVADNAIIQPKQYQIEALISDGTDSIVIQRLAPYVLNTAQEIVQALKANDFASGALATANLTASAVSKTALATLTLIFGANLIEDLTQLPTGGITGFDWKKLIPNTNKISIEAMWQSRRLLKMKMWDSWDYKYGIIKNLTIDKEPTDNNNVYKATMTFQEMPILTYRDKGSTSSQSTKQTVSKVTNKIVLATLDSLEAKN